MDAYHPPKHGIEVLTDKQIDTSSYIEVSGHLGHPKTTPLIFKLRRPVSPLRNTSIHRETAPLKVG